jgi:hypothetical protein
MQYIYSPNKTRGTSQAACMFLKIEYNNSYDTLTVFKNHEVPAICTYIYHNGKSDYYLHIAWTVHATKHDCLHEVGLCTVYAIQCDGSHDVRTVHNVNVRTETQATCSAIKIVDDNYRRKLIKVLQLLAQEMNRVGYIITSPVQTW